MAGILAMAVHPIPYYISAFVLLIVFGYLWPILPISDAYDQGLTPGLDAGLPAVAGCGMARCRCCRW